MVTCLIYFFDGGFFEMKSTQCSMFLSCSSEQPASKEAELWCKSRGGGGVETQQTLSQSTNASSSSFSFFQKWIQTYFSLVHCFSISCCKIKPRPMDLAENGPDFVNTATYIDNWPCSTKIIWYFSPSETIQQLEVFTLPWPHLDPHWAQCQSGKVQQNIVQYWTSDKPLINHDSCSQTLLPFLKIAILKSHMNMV